MKSHKAMNDFITVHEIESDSFGNIHFEATIEYDSPLKNITTGTEVTFIRNGYNDGEIKLTENNYLTVNDYHLDFTPSWQEYKFEEASGKLIVTGKSVKMGGKYCVTLFPA